MAVVKSERNELTIRTALKLGEEIKLPGEVEFVFKKL